jgi:hypothetical protein
MMTRLLDHPSRPLPLSPTHYLMVDVLRRDTSIKRVTIYFNPKDGWDDSTGNFERNTPKAAYNEIASNLRFLDIDKTVIAYKCYLIDIETQKVISDRVYTGEIVDL